MLPRLSPAQWTWDMAAHLLNRAGFGGAPSEIDRFHQQGLEASIAELFTPAAMTPAPSPDTPWARPDPERGVFLQKIKAASEEEKRLLLKEVNERERRYLFEMRQHWLGRMHASTQPLLEKTTLFWHGHFATSIQKVKDTYLMWLQNETFRRHALGSWEEMLIAVAKDPAMLNWLDGAQSRAKMPNENFAREVMELFTLGEGHYTEDDIQTAAKAFVGWTFARESQAFVVHPEAYNKKPLPFLGQEKVWHGEDILRRLAQDPISAQYLMERLWRFFANEQPAPETIAGLVETFTQGQRRLAPVLRELFSSAIFYTPEVVRQQVKSPTQWLIQTCRVLEIPLPLPLLTSQMMRQLGQELFAPPSVKGWDGGVSWISTNQLLNRYNFAAMLVMGQGTLVPQTGNDNKDRPSRDAQFQERLEKILRPVEVAPLFTAAQKSTPDVLIKALAQRLMQTPLKPAREQALRDLLAKQPALNDKAIREAVLLLMTLPEYQLT
jgi:Protein of unknown function (DUF1800)